ncbi:hypothetical protein ACHAWF_016361 [Thalassiosira exigua]
MGAGETSKLLDPESSPQSTMACAGIRGIDPDAVRFGVRMAVCITTSSLFVLLRTPDSRLSEAMWVLVTVLFVCWFPSLDAASVLEKSLQRLYGTLIGAAAALACGFPSLAVERRWGYRVQAGFLAGCFFLQSFAVCCGAMHVRVGGGGARIISKYNYATLLCVLTFAICLLPFYSPSARRGWEKSVYRLFNVIIGCILGVGLSMVVFPRPTVSMLREKLSRQVALAGEASEAVLHMAADAFSEKAYAPRNSVTHNGKASLGKRLRMSWTYRMPTTRRPWRKIMDDPDPSSGQVVLEKYEAASSEWKVAKSQLGMLKYDPFNLGRPSAELERFHAESANALARAMRIQTTVVLMDGIVRNDPNHKFDEKQLRLMASTGTLIRRMLTVPLGTSINDVAAQELAMNLTAMRRTIVELTVKVASSPSQQLPNILSYESSLGEMDELRNDLKSASESCSNLLALEDEELRDDSGGKAAPKHVHGSIVCSLLFLQLAEHLGLRSIRLYQSWKQFENLCMNAGDNRASTHAN